MEHYLKKVGFFGGTFDPIHFGHLNLAISLAEARGLDELLFCPAYLSPGKQEAHPVFGGVDRLEMVRLAIEGIPLFKTLDWELHREGPSYTIDTIRYLKSIRPKDQFFLVLGKHAAEEIGGWKEANELVKVATPLVAIRPGGSSPCQGTPFEQVIAKGAIEVPSMEISSTTIRERLRQKKPCNHLVPSKVLDYIESKRLY